MATLLKLLIWSNWKLGSVVSLGLLLGIQTQTKSLSLVLEALLGVGISESFLLGVCIKAAVSLVESS